MVEIYKKSTNMVAENSEAENGCCRYRNSINRKTVEEYYYYSGYYFIIAFISYQQYKQSFTSLQVKAMDSQY